MSISNNRQDRDKAAYIENPDDQGTDRRVQDLVGNDLLQDIVNALAGASAATKTIHDNGTVGTSNIQVPSTPGGKIHSILIKNKESNPADAIIKVSFDGGTEYFDILNNENFTIDVASKPTQIDLIATEAGVEYQILMNTE